MALRLGQGQGFPGDASLPVHGTVTTLRDWAEDAVSLRSRASARTKADYRRDLERHMYPYLGALPVDGGITARHVAEWLDALEVSGLAPKTIANIHGLVSSIMSDGTAHRPPVCDHNPFAPRLRASPDVRVEEMVFLTPAEFELIHRNVPAFYQLLALLLFATGLRFGEATALRVADFALDGRRRTLTVVRAWKRQPDSTYRIGEPKTRRGRRTPAAVAEGRCAATRTRQRPATRGAGVPGTGGRADVELDVPRLGVGSRGGAGQRLRQARRGAAGDAGGAHRAAGPAARHGQADPAAGGGPLV